MRITLSFTSQIGVLATILNFGVTGAIIQCNGFEELCDLNIEQVTLAGTHNSGAGFDSHLNFHTVLGKVKAVSCWYRNQMQSIYNQLELGIRYFDIDSCWQEDYKPEGAWACHNGAYGGSARKLFQQIDEWMNEERNRNEVIVLHFNRDFEEGTNREVGIDILKLLKQFWGAKGNIKEKPLTIQTSTGASLGRSIAMNRRIYVIGHTSLIRNTLTIPHYMVGYTWVSMSYIASNGCQNLIEKMNDKRCFRESFHPFVRYDLYLSSGLCIHDMASKCRQYIDDGVRTCFEGTRRNHRTVNFIVVDYATEKVVRVAAEQNKRNIKFYLGKDVLVV